jgi:hypothetical protein
LLFLFLLNQTHDADPDDPDDAHVLKYAVQTAPQSVVLRFSLSWRISYQIIRLSARTNRYSGEGVWVRES